jgi:hypothetical protein
MIRFETKSGGLMVVLELISPSVYLDHWASYCDYVLLDNAWTTRVNQMRARFTKAGVCIPMAKVFSKKNDKLESFFNELEG